MTDLSSPSAAAPLVPHTPATTPVAPSPAATEPPSGLNCPRCARPLDRVLFTRRVAGSIRRVRKCEPCGRRWQTAETIVAGVPEARGRTPAA
jgi:hypothetical protein